MPDIHRRIVIRAAATDAVLRVRRVLERGPTDERVIDAVADRLPSAVGELRDERIVGVDDEGRRVGEAGDRVAPALGDVLELAVAVELVAKEVPEGDHARRDGLDDRRERELVDLEQPQLGVARGEESGADAGGEVRTRVVPGKPVGAAEQLGDHRRRRRLAVRRRDDDRPVRETSRELGDSAAIDLPEELSGQRRPTAATREPGDTPDEARSAGFAGKADSHSVERTGGLQAEPCSGALADSLRCSTMIAWRDLVAGMLPSKGSIRLPSRRSAPG